jgi:hypothetical protein
MTTLTKIAADANAAHERCRAAAGEALEHALTAGRLLLQAKANVPHGEWSVWVSKHCMFSERLAQTYMRLSRELPKVNPQRVADLSVRAAVKLLANPKPVADPWHAVEDWIAVERDHEARIAAMSLEEVVAFLNSPRAQLAELTTLIEAKERCLDAVREAGLKPEEYFATVAEMASERMRELAAA